MIPTLDRCMETYKCTQKYLVSSCEPQQVRRRQLLRQAIPFLMAPSYSAAAYNFSACISQASEPKVPWPNTNPCVPEPSSLNPYNITSLASFTPRMLREILTNRFFGVDLDLCQGLADVLPSDFPSINRVLERPGTLDLRVAALRNLTRRTVPSPYNESGPASVTAWWFDHAASDEAEMSDFLETSKDACLKQICKSWDLSADADITGIGVSEMLGAFN